MLKRKKFLISGTVVVLAIAYLAYMGFQGSATYYYAVSELADLGSSVHGENVRVNGQVAAGSVEQDTEERILRFTIVDVEEEESLPVVYQGVVPDTFKTGNDVVVEGYLNSEGVFQANNILAKCPSKYVPEE